MTATADEFMRESDAFSWYLEGDPALRATIVAVAWFDRAPDWDRLVARLERATRLVPVFRRIPHEPPGRLATPRWAVDPDFDLSWHLRRVGSPAPHTPETVLDLARVAAMTGFDTAHPLWEFTLVENLVGGGAALVMKVHHSLTDGIGGMQLLLVLFDTDARGLAAASGALPDAPTGAVPGGAELVVRSVAHEATKALGLLRSAAGAAVPSLWHVGRHPLRRARSGVETLRSVGRTVAPVLDTASPVMRARGLGRRLAMLQVDLAELKSASKAAGGSLNDGFVAAVTGGLRRYHEHHRAPVGELRVTLPISIRTPDDPAAGNRITLERFRVPVALADPASRIRATGERCRAARRRAIAPPHQRHRRCPQPAPAERREQHAQARRLPGEQCPRAGVPRVPGRCPHDALRAVRAHPGRGLQRHAALLRRHVLDRGHDGRRRHSRHRRVHALPGRRLRRGPGLGRPGPRCECVRRSSREPRVARRPCRRSHHRRPQHRPRRHCRPFGWTRGGPRPAR